VLAYKWIIAEPFMPASIIGKDGEDTRHTPGPALLRLI